MKKNGSVSFLLAALAASLCFCALPASAQKADAPPAPAAAETPIAPPAQAPVAAPAAAAPTPEQQAALAGARAPAVSPAAAPSAVGSLLQTVLALAVVLGLLVGLAWMLKRFGPRHITGGTTVKLVGALSVGARERILVVEVGEQWIVVGASPGRMNALATLPRQETPDLPEQPHGALPAANFAEWFKQTIEKRNGK
ncbi:flagellar biosynthetic protein FliO [Massilia endophytica]|uniref:flagellar biosynthetic protein FliO n=1 Tax=Massilia endophytica TaxID=2899220 RepID=UPI001E417693|nr:flagellar biosynthetic protein FliO [Massilia endophytica]UGQ45219.1 flagellar biosynthetic protein FliO [Massilia endophytica]